MIAMELITKTKTKKQGNSISVTLPVQTKVEAGVSYILYKKDNGTLILIPELNDIFASAKDGEFRQEIVWDDYAPQGKETLEIIQPFIH
jgi:antitoxin component of MazEF toxin-antitoxin module